MRNWVIITLLGYLILLAISLSSCNASKKCERVSSKAIRLKCFKNDTITKYDSILGFKLDTLIKFDTLNFEDTIVVVKNGVEVKTIIKWKERVVSQSVTQKDTIIKTDYINRTITQTKKVIPLWAKFIIGLFLGFLQFVILKKLFKW
jgi:DNA topoisomerase VI subunit A